MTSRDKEKLDGIAKQIQDNLIAEESNVNESKWARACLYSEARAIFPSDPQFGKWIKSYSAGAGRQETTGVISKLMMCHRLLTKEQFVAMGYTKAAELMNKSMWKNHEAQMEHLVTVAHQYSQRELRELVKGIKNGIPVITPPPPPKTAEELLEEVNKKLDQANIVIGILRGEYVHSDESFFHPDEHLRQMQIDELNKGSKYSCLFFGITKASEVTEEIVKAGYRRLSKQYHPDRGGSQEIMTLINKLNDHFGNIFSLK